MELSKSLKTIIDLCAADGDKIAVSIIDLLKNSTDEFIGGVGFLDISKSDPEKINFVPEARKKSFSKVCIKIGDVIQYTCRETGSLKIGKIFKYNESTEKVVVCKVKLDDTGEEVTKRIDGLTFITPQLRFDFWDTDIRKKNTQKTTPGKVFQTILKSHIKFKPIDIDNFVKQYYLFNDKILNGIFQILEGEDVRTYYNEKKCLMSAASYSSSSLGKSCMRYQDAQKYLDIYTQNKERIKLLVLIKEDKVVARSLMWYDASIVDPNNKHTVINKINFLDRIYCIDTKDEEKFKNWAKKNNFYFKRNQSADYKKNFVNPEGKEEVLSIFFENINTSFQKYPYMDTMTYSTGKKEFGLLTNFEYRNRLEFRSTSGSYTEHECNEEWSEYHQETHPKRLMYRSTCMNSWILKEFSVQLQDGDYAIKDSEFVFEYKDMYYRKDNCIVSVFHGSTFPKEVVIKIDEDYYLKEEVDNYKTFDGKNKKAHKSFIVYCVFMACNILESDLVIASDNSLIPSYVLESYETLLNDINNEMFNTL